MDKTPRIRKTIIAAGCALTLSAMLGACGSNTSSASPKGGGITGSAPSPSTATGSTSATATVSGTPSTATTPDGTLSTHPNTSAGSSQSGPSAPAGAPTSEAPPSVVSDFLRPDQLPDLPSYRWSRQYITEVNVEHPLEPVCGKSLGPEQNKDVWDARYPAADGQSAAEETVHTYASATIAASRVAAYSPTCPGLTAHTPNGFAWSGTDSGSGLTSHVLYVNVGPKVAVVLITLPKRDYAASLDAKLLQTMAQRLAGS